jgi:hypothetical protein
MAPPKSTAEAWKHVKKEGNSLIYQLCGHNFSGSLTRAVDHLLGISDGSGGGVEEFLNACAIPFNMARNLYCQNAFKKAVEFGKGYVPSGSEAPRMILLKQTKESMTDRLGDIKESWKFTGCTITLMVGQIYPINH